MGDWADDEERSRDIEQERRADEGSQAMSEETKMVGFNTIQEANACPGCTMLRAKLERAMRELRLWDKHFGGVILSEAHLGEDGVFVTGEPTTAREFIAKEALTPKEKP